VWPSKAVTYEARWYDASGRRHTENDDSPTEADRARQEHPRERRRGGFVDPTGGRVTLAAWHEHWAAARLVAINTKARGELIWRSQVEPAFGGAQLADLRRSAVAAWAVELAQKLAPATVVCSLALLPKMLNDAVLEGLISTNPAALVALVKPERIERRFLSLDEIQRVQAAVEPWWSFVVPFAVTTGLRIGELAALMVGDLVLASRELHVRATAVGVTRRFSGAEHRRQLQRPKTAAGERVVPTITDDLADRLAAHIDERGLSLDDWLFAGPHGGPMSPDNWRARVWRPAVERAGLADYTPTPHGL
jgi:integrase